MCREEHKQESLCLGHNGSKACETSREEESLVFSPLSLAYRSGKLPHTSSLMIKQAGI